MSEISGNALRGHLETMILSILERGESHGFEILRRLEEEGRGALRLKEGTLYPALYRLEEAGFVKAQWETEAGGRRGPRRRIYHITTAGKRELAKQREAWVHFTSIIGQIVGSKA